MLAYVVYVLKGLTFIQYLDIRLTIQYDSDLVMFGEIHWISDHDCTLDVLNGLENDYIVKDTHLVERNL